MYKKNISRIFHMQSNISSPEQADSSKEHIIQKLANTIKEAESLSETPENQQTIQKAQAILADLQESTSQRITLASDDHADSSQPEPAAGGGSSKASAGYFLLSDVYGAGEKTFHDNPMSEEEENKKKKAADDIIIVLSDLIAKKKKEDEIQNITALTEQITQEMRNIPDESKGKYQRLLAKGSNPSEVAITQLQNNFSDKKRPWSRRTQTAAALLFLYLDTTQYVDLEKLIKGEKTLVVTFETDKITPKHREFIKAQIQECIKLGIACPPDFMHKSADNTRKLNLTEIGLKSTTDMHLMSLVKDIPGSGIDKIDEIKKKTAAIRRILKKDAVTVSTTPGPDAPTDAEIAKSLVGSFLQEAFKRSPHDTDESKLQDIASILKLGGWSNTTKEKTIQVIEKLKNSQDITTKAEQKIADDITSKVLRSMDARLEKIEKSITPKVSVSKDTATLDTDTSPHP